MTREGTDYGHAGPSLAGKSGDVLRQLEDGRAVILFDERTETCNIVTRKELAGKGGADEDGEA